MVTFIVYFFVRPYYSRFRDASGPPPPRPPRLVPLLARATLRLPTVLPTARPASRPVVASAHPGPRCPDEQQQTRGGGLPTPAGAIAMVWRKAVHSRRTVLPIPSRGRDRQCRSCVPPPPPPPPGTNRWPRSRKPSRLSGHGAALRATVVSQTDR